MSSNPLSIADPALGMFQSAEMATFTPDGQQAGVNFIHSCTNLSVYERKLVTRPAWRELALDGDAGKWLTANTQGAIPYDPTIGVSANQARGPQCIIESAGGELFKIIPGRRTFTVEPIGNGVKAPAADRIAFLEQATNYVIRTARTANTQIYDGITTTTSAGYYPDQPSFSQLPNFAGPLAFTNRVWIAHKGTVLLAGDQINATDVYTNSDVLRTSQQATDITDSTYSAPFTYSSQGEAIGAWVVPSYRGGNIAAQAEIYIATQGGGVWSILGGQPRQTWGTVPMGRGISEDTGPSGPYAAWVGIDELVFRSNRGISSIKTLTQESSAIANPHIEIGQEILPLLQKDSPDLLLYASCSKVQDQQRLLFTVNPKVRGAHRWHGGYVSAALAPDRSRAQLPLTWESVGTLPASMGEIIQFVRMRNLSGTSTYAILRKPDGTKGLAQYTSEYGDDTLSDGTPARIPWQILTRRLGQDGDYTPATWQNVWLLLKDVRDSVDVRVMARGNSKDPFREYWSGTVKNRTWGLECGTDDRSYAQPDPISLGDIFRDVNTPWIEILIQGTGCCMVDMAFGKTGSSSARPDPSSRNQTIPGDILRQFDIFRRAP